MLSEGEIPANLIDAAQKARDKMIETVSETDDALMEKYLNGEVPSAEELKPAIRKGCIDLKFFPVFCGSALKNKGVQLMLDAVVDYLPSPLDIPDPGSHQPQDR